MYSILSYPQNNFANLKQLNDKDQQGRDLNEIVI